jgi:hypothetical protein
MKKLIFVSITIASLCVLGYYAYHHFLTSVVADSITSEKSAAWIPTHVSSKINKIKKPVNEMATEVVKQAHASNVTMDDIIRAIDNAEEEQAYAMLDELNKKEIKNTDEVFTMAKKYFPVDFDVEIFREVFNKKISMGHINKGIKLANQYKNQDEIDAETAKTILKKILLQKEEEFNSIVKKD